MKEIHKGAEIWLQKGGEERAGLTSSLSTSTSSKAWWTDVKAHWEEFYYFVEDCAKLSKAQLCIIEEEPEYFVQNKNKKVLRVYKFCQICDYIRLKQADMVEMLIIF